MAGIVAFDVHRDHAIPPLAWLLHVSEAGGRLLCGDHVEVRPDGFFEGAWSGEFDRFDFVGCAEVFGSGGKIAQGTWTLVPPSHTLEAIYVLWAKSGGFVAANSLAFIRSCVDFRFSGSSRSILTGFCGIVAGIPPAPPRIETSAGPLQVIHHRNASLAAGSIVTARKPEAPAFDSYEAYYEYLVQTTTRVAANAAAGQRRRSYRLLATISSGYDSPACATIAGVAGCTRAVTFVDARGGAADDGIEIGRLLGMTVEPHRRPAAGLADRESCAEFFATGMQGEDMVYDVLRGTIGGSVLVTGFHGDKIWDRSGKPNDKLKRGDVSGSSLAEFRLREGFIHLPLAFSGALRHDLIRRISNAAEMSRYMVGGSYDRPIPRRIAEEGGIPRHLFGQDKKAVSLLVFLRHDLLPPTIRHEVRATMSGRSIRYRLTYMTQCCGFTVAMFLYRLAAAARRLPGRWGRMLAAGSMRFLGAMVGLPPETLEHTHPVGVLLLEWSLSVVATRYRAAARAF